MVKIYMSDTHDPYFNIATEMWMFNTHEAHEPILFLWRNEPTVVIGRSQNPWVECDLEKMKTAGVHLVRRHSGGGAVYHDLGNSIFTFISPIKAYDKHNNNQLIIRALKKWNIEAEASGRNDLIVHQEGVRKFSGSGFKQTKDRALHHGTILLNTDLAALQQYLQPQRSKLLAKGIASVSSRVINLTELNSRLNHDRICSSLIDEFRDFYGESCEPLVLDYAVLQKIPELAREYEQLKSWDWMYGKTMEFVHPLEHRFEWGGVDVRLIVESGVVQEAVIYSDSLYPDLIAAFAEALTGRRYEASDILEALRACDDPEHAFIVKEFSAWLITQL